MSKEKDMSFLDKLRHEAEQKAQGEELERAQQERREQCYRQQLRPPMLTALEYLKEVVDHLNYLESSVQVEMPIAPDSAESVSLEQADYKFNFDDGQNPRQLEVFCNCSLTSPRRFHLPTGNSAQKYAELLDRYSFAYERKNYLDEHYSIQSADFELKGPLSVCLRLSADADAARIVVEMWNLEDQPRRRYSFRPERLNTELLDRIAKVLARQEARLFTTEVSEEMRTALSRQARTSLRAKQSELERIERERMAEAEAAADKTAFARLRKFLLGQ